MINRENIRNFVIIAHIDHGKSTLADRFLEITNTVQKRDMKDQLLDTMDLERERGITIKLQPVRMLYKMQMNADIDADKRRYQTDVLANSHTDEDRLLYKDLTYKIRGAFFNVYNALGPGHKETIYHNALKSEFSKLNINFETEKTINVKYNGKNIGSYKPDFVVDDKVIIELKTLPFMGKLEEKQTWTYLQGSEYKLAILANFGAKELQIKRIVYDTARSVQRQSASSIRVNPQDLVYTLNLIDTPGHVDFSYEVSRSLAAVEGAILLVDASQGIEAQTLANIYLALEHNLEIIPVINKIDLPHAEPERVAKEMMELLGIKKEEILFVSGKTGEGVEKALQRIVEKISPPRKSEKDYPRALIFDSFFDAYKGVITYVRVFDGEFKKGDKIEMIMTGKKAEILEIGYMLPKLAPKDSLETGEIGYIVTGLKDVADARVGDTITKLKVKSKKLEEKDQKSKVETLKGYKEVTPFVFAGLFPASSDDYLKLKEALNKLSLSDSSLVFEPESSHALGFGYRCGFLGLLHLEIVKERLERENNLDLIVTNPSVTYKVILNNNKEITIKNPSELPDLSKVREIKEPWLKIEIVSPSQYVGNIMKLVQKKGGIQKGMQYLDKKRIVLTYEIPMSSVITNFYDDLKSVSSGYASLNYEVLDFRTGDLQKLDILISGNKVDSLSLIVHKNDTYKTGLKIVEKLKKSIPKQMFKVTLQAAVGSKILAREDIPALRKDVTAKLYGGDVTRKRKLLEKQKKGKKKMKSIGNVEIPTKVFLDLLKK